MDAAGRGHSRMWKQHLWNLLERAKDNALALGGSTLAGVAVGGLCAIFLGFAITVLIEWYRGGRTETSLRDAVRSWPPYLGGAAGLLVAWALMFVWSVGATVFQDHQTSWTAVNAWKQKAEEGAHCPPPKLPKRSWTQPSNGQGGPLGPIMAVEMVQTFKTVTSCTISLTAPAEMSSFRDTLRWLLTEPQIDGGAGCTLWREVSPPSVDDLPSPKQTSIRGIVIHWNLASRDGERIAHFFDSSGLKISTSHQMPPHSGSTLIWIDIGPGSPWKSIAAP
jgi:hypothetical protein